MSNLYIEVPEPIEEVEQTLETPEPTRVVLDVLPYIDAFDEQSRRSAQDLIDLEMKSMVFTNTKSPVHSEFTTTSLQMEYEARRTTGKSLLSSIEPLITMPVEPDPGASWQDWEHAVQRSKIYLEYSKNKIELLELLQAFGTNAALQHNQLLETFRDKLKALLTQYRTQKDNINTERNSEQKKIGARLNALHEEWASLVKKNLELEQALHDLQDTPSDQPN